MQAAGERQDRMKSSCVLAPVVLMLMAVQLINAEPDSGTVIPSESKIFIKKFSFSHSLHCLYAFVHDKRCRINTAGFAILALPHNMEMKHIYTYQ